MSGNNHLKKHRLFSSNHLTVKHLFHRNVSKNTYCHPKRWYGLFYLKYFLVHDIFLQIPMVILEINKYNLNNKNII